MRSSGGLVVGFKLGGGCVHVRFDVRVGADGGS